MKQKILSLLLVVIALLGMFDAGYITYEKFSGRIPSCRPPFECGTVLNSKWAYIAGIPLSIYGLGFYTIVFILAILNFTEIEFNVPINKSVRKTLYLLTTLGFGFSLYLVSLMQFVIQAWCLWCLVSAITSSSLFVVAMLLKRSEQHALDVSTE